jgi:tRNA G18 (ribose-2'-O)-methylase SpoU
MESHIVNGFNVHDSLKNLSKEQIQKVYSDKRHKAAVAMTHVEGDFNLSNVIRSANFFGFKEVFYIGGKKKWDRRGAVGTQNYIPVIYCPTYEYFFNIIQNQYVPVALENNKTKNPINIFRYKWPINTVIVCGEEQKGIPIELLDKINICVEIPAYGTVRSLNVGTAAGIAMSFYNQHHSDSITGVESTI